MNKTFNLKQAETSREWVILDATEAPLGRVATAAAKRLIGKHKPTYTAHVDNGDFVIIINADKAIVTGNKQETKSYYSYSGFPSGLKTTQFKDMLQKDATRIFMAAVKGMLPRNKLIDGRLKRLKVYSGEAHNHEAQKPVKIGVK